MNTPSQPCTYDAKIRATVADINALLCNLRIPVTLESPHDLTPSLLVMALELMLQHRLPISQAMRAAKDAESKIKTMEVFIEVLRDVVGEDQVILDDMDPRMLAIGEWDEVVTVAEALVLVGRASGLISQSSRNSFKESPSTETSQVSRTMPALPQSQDDSTDPFWVPALNERSFPRSPLPTVESTKTSSRSPALVSKSINSDSSNSSPATSRLMSRREELSFETTILTASPGSPLSSSRSDDQSHDTGSSSRSRRAPSSLSSTRVTPRCIHEVGGMEDDLSRSFEASVSLTDEPIRDSSICSSTNGSPAKKTPVRYTGWIEPVDEEEEIRSFEAKRRIQRGLSRLELTRTPRTAPDYGGGLSLGSPLKSPSTSTHGRVLTRHNSPTQHTLALMNERAKLLEELAALKAAKLR